MVGAYDHTIATGSFTLASPLHKTVAGRKLQPFSSIEVITTNPPAARLAVSQPTGGAQEQVAIGGTEYLQVAASMREVTTKRWLASPLMPQAGVTNSRTIGTVVTSRGVTGSLSGGPLAPLNLVKGHASGQVQELGLSTIGTTLWRWIDSVGGRRRLRSAPRGESHRGASRGRRSVDRGSRERIGRIHRDDGHVRRGRIRRGWSHLPVPARVAPPVVNPRGLPAQVTDEADASVSDNTNDLRSIRPGQWLVATLPASGSATETPSRV